MIFLMLILITISFTYYYFQITQSKKEIINNSNINNSEISIDYIKQNCYLYKNIKEYVGWKCKEGQVLWIKNY